MNRGRHRKHKLSLKKYLNFEEFQKVCKIIENTQIEYQKNLQNQIIYGYEGIKRSNT